MIISKISLVIDGKEVSISIKDAEVLYRDLHSIFGKKEAITVGGKKGYLWESKPYPSYMWYSTGGAGE